MFPGFPQADATKKCILVLSSFGSFWQTTETVHETAAEDDIIRDEGFSQLSDCVSYFSLPFFLAQQLESRNAKVIFNDVPAAVRQIAEFKRHQGFVPHQRGPQSSAEAQKEHPPAAVTAESLHCSVVHNAHWNAQRSGKIETNPSFAQMFRVSSDSSLADGRGETKRSPVKFPTAHGFVEFYD